MNLLTTSQLKRMIDGNESFELINVLPESEFQREHIPGSISRYKLGMLGRMTAGHSMESGYVRA